MINALSRASRRGDEEEGKAAKLSLLRRYPVTLIALVLSLGALVPVGAAQAYTEYKFADYLPRSEYQRATAGVGNVQGERGYCASNQANIVVETVANTPQGPGPRLYNATNVSCTMVGYTHGLQGNAFGRCYWDNFDAVGTIIVNCWVRR